MIQYHIAIIGCGPGGMAAALFLKQQGHDVTIFERFAEAGPVGSGLLIQPSGQAVLERLSLSSKIKALSCPVGQLHGISVTNGCRALDMHYANAHGGIPALGIHRASLFSVLMDAVRAADIPVIPNCELTSFSEDEHSITPHFAGDVATESFDFLIDASGARSPLAQGSVLRLPFGAFWATVDIPARHDVLPGALDQRYHRARQMAGIMPVGYNPATGHQGAAVFWSEKPERAEAVIAEGIDAFRARVVDLWPEAEPFVAQIQSMDDLTLAVYHHRTGPAYQSPRLIHVGDSWHCTSPQLGQGANMALIDAAMLANAFASSAELKEIAPRFQRQRAFHIHLYQLLSRVFTPLYQSEGYLPAAFRDFTIHNFARWPFVKGFIAQTVSGSLGMPRLGD